MARYKPYDINQITLIPISFPDQILCGSFEYALNEIVDQHIDLRPFESRYQNDETGCLAYHPAILLKIVLFGYYKGLISSRRLAEACERNVQFKALTADTQPDFTTIADFVATMHQEIAEVFCDVLIYADALGLIGEETFAIDGCKLPSNASKEWSGTHDELKNKQQKYKLASKKILDRYLSRVAKEKLSPMAEQVYERTTCRAVQNGRWILLCRKAVSLLRSRSRYACWRLLRTSLPQSRLTMQVKQSGSS